MTDKEDNIITMYTRVAWFDRDTEKYSFGNWHCLTSKNPKEYQNLQNWIKKQNKKYPRTKYWIEIKDNSDALAKNTETYELVPITTEESKEKEAYTEWLAL